MRKIIQKITHTVLYSSCSRCDRFFFLLFIVFKIKHQARGRLLQHVRCEQNIFFFQEREEMLKALMSDWADFKDKNMRKKTPKPRNSCGGESFRSVSSTARHWTQCSGSKQLRLKIPKCAFHCIR
jgi:hypothetical protein